MAELIGVPAETAAGEKRVATVPEVVEKLIKLGFRVTVQSGAGDAAREPFGVGGGVVVADPEHGKAAPVGDGVPAEVYRLATVLCPNEHEAAALTGQPLQFAHVDQALGGGEVLLVRLGEGAGIAATMRRKAGAGNAGGET